MHEDKKTVLVTGALSGLGRVISRVYSERGFFVYGTARTAEGKDFPYGKLLPLELTGGDLSSLDGIKSLDVLVNNAGIFTLGAQDVLSDEAFDAVIDVNVKGLFSVTRKMLPLLKASDGAIVNISSMNAFHPGFGGTAHYDASKGFVSSYTRSLAAETGLRVNAVAPGLIERKDLIGSELGERYSQHSVKKSMMEPEEIAETVFFLSSQSGIYGQTILVDNGYTLL